LAKKLKDCGVFGVSSDEYLSYAKQNRLEWEKKGEGIVAQFLEKYNSSSTIEEEVGEEGSDSFETPEKGPSSSLSPLFLDQQEENPPERTQRSKSPAAA
jgi:hypothetical protein